MRKKGEVYTLDGWWQIYMIELDNRGKKTTFYGMTKLYYTGITTNIGRRMGDYLLRRGRKGFVNSYWATARRTPVYIEHFNGNEFGAMKREKQIKRLSLLQKKRLIESDKNKLVAYKLLQHLIVRSPDNKKDFVYKIK